MLDKPLYKHIYSKLHKSPTQANFITLKYFSFHLENSKWSKMALMGTWMILLVTVSFAIMAVGSSNTNFQKGPQNWNFEYNYTNMTFRHPKPIQSSRRIIIGGSDNWRFGFNYTEWARTNAPFFFNDTLGMYLYGDVSFIHLSLAFILPKF